MECQRPSKSQQVGITTSEKDDPPWQEQQEQLCGRVPVTVMPAIPPTPLPPRANEHECERHRHQGQHSDGLQEGPQYQQLQQDRQYHQQAPSPQDAQVLTPQHPRMQEVRGDDGAMTESMAISDPASIAIIPALPSKALKPAALPGTTDSYNSVEDAAMLSMVSTVSATASVFAADDVSVASNGGSPQHRPLRAGSVLSMDDPDVRIAAEALGDLRADFVSSPSMSHCAVPRSPPAFPPPSLRRQSHDITMARHPQVASIPRRSSHQLQSPQPLLSLLSTNTHPLLSTAISGSLSAYSTSKSYSPRFKSGAEFVERHIGQPVATTVNTVGRRTGVEGGVRWWLGSRRSSAVANGEEDNVEDESEGGGQHKRRKISNATTHTHHSFDIEGGVYGNMHNHVSSRRPSQLSFESLPAYDGDGRSPSYDETQAQHERHMNESGALVTTSTSPTCQQATTTTTAANSTGNSTWSSRLMLSTSGLGVAMSEDSLRSLKYCLAWLRWANVHLRKVVVALKTVIEEWESSTRHGDTPLRASIESSGSDGRIAIRSEPDMASPEHSPTSQTLMAVSSPVLDEAALAARINILKADVLDTLKKVVNIVSKYTGGALPENARLLVRRHLTSLPARFKLASGSNSHHATRRAAVDSKSEVHGSGPSRPEAVSGASRVMVLASEGLDMMAQVSGVLDGTIASAEEWCERLGRRKRGEREDIDGDVEKDGEMGDDEATPTDPKERGGLMWGADVKHRNKPNHEEIPGIPAAENLHLPQIPALGDELKKSVPHGEETDAKTPTAEGYPEHEVTRMITSDSENTSASAAAETEATPKTALPLPSHTDERPAEDMETETQLAA